MARVVPELDGPSLEGPLADASDRHSANEPTRRLVQWPKRRASPPQEMSDSDEPMVGRNPLLRQAAASVKRRSEPAVPTVVGPTWVSQEAALWAETKVRQT